MKNKNRGFTLIELLVVIAIIGILAAVVLSALNSARKTAGNAAIKSNLVNLIAQAELFNTANNGYGANGYAQGVCPDTLAGPTPAGNLFEDDQQIINQLNGARTNSGVLINSCGSDVASWAVVFPLRIIENGKDPLNNPAAFDAWCVDSNGTSRGEVTGATAGIVQADLDNLITTSPSGDAFSCK